MNHQREVILKERDNLRNELHDLKGCQVRYFMFSITAAGTLVEIGSQFGGKGYASLFYLAPLIIVIPCWRVFFDKATTITRLVGYIRVLELILERKDIEDLRYIGWENSLNIFRMVEKKKEGKTTTNKDSMSWAGLIKNVTDKRHVREYISVIKEALTLKTTKRYWIINYYTFLLVSVFCFSLSLIFIGASEIGIGGALIFILVAFFFIVRTLHRAGGILCELTNGDKSYETNYKKWVGLLRAGRIFYYELDESRRGWFYLVRGGDVIGPYETRILASEKLKESVDNWKLANDAGGRC